MKVREAVEVGLHPALSRDRLNVACGVTKKESPGFCFEPVA